MFGKVLIANRGEIAVRIARTCRSMGLGTVAVFSDVDEHALHLDVCDEAVRLGGATPAESYLRGDLVVDACLRTGAQAVHPGFGFLSENAEFAQAVVDAGLVWVGPPPEVIAAMGDKITAKSTMSDAGVPLVPGELLDGDVVLSDAGDRVGYPLMVKATAGGGGKGMRVVRAPDELDEAVAAARREAAAAFGDDRVFLERLVTRPRHIEIQVLADAHGRVVHLFERECSIQRRHQKVLEESPSPGIDEEVRTAMGRAAVAAAEAIGYVGAGTVEFIASESVLERRRNGEQIDPRKAFAFLEVNTRLQVEHPVTEEVVRVVGERGHEPVDLVRLQLLVAAGEPLPFDQDQLVQVGHAIEARLYAEDPAAGYLPVTGVLHEVGWEQVDGVRYDSGVQTGDIVSPHYDPMLAKVIARAPSRLEAASRLARALQRSTVHGVTTNRDLLVQILGDGAFLAGDTTTAYLEERFGDHDDRRIAHTEAEVRTALVVATVAQALRWGSPTDGGLPIGFSSSGTIQHDLTFEVGDEQRRVRYRQQGGWRVRVDDGPWWAVRVEERADGDLHVEVDGHRWRTRSISHGASHQVRTPRGWVELSELPRFPEVAAPRAAGVTLAPMPGSVVAVAVVEGDEVVEGDLLVTIEAMKMEHRVTAPFAGCVTEVHVAAGQQVESDEVLVVVASDDVPA